MPHFFEAPLEELARFAVPLAKLGQHLLQQGADFGFRERHDAPADLDGALVGIGPEGTDQHAGRIGMEGDVGALEVNCFHK